MNGKRMTHPKHTTAAQGKQPKTTAPTGKLPIGVRSADLIRRGRKSAVIVPVIERPWVRHLALGDAVRMPINVEGKGFIDVKATGCCLHPTLASIPECARGHRAAQFDAEADWHTVLTKAAWGSNRPSPPATMDARAAEGWFVLDFKPTRVPKEWRHREKRRAETAG